MSMRRSLALAASAIVVLGSLSVVGVAPAVAAAPPTCQGRPATIVGTGRSVVGTDGPDVIVGTERGEFIDGGGGDDLICGGGGDDDVRGGDGVDTLIGGPGDDQLRAGSFYAEGGDPDGSEVVIGGDGDDLLVGADGADVLRGGPGSDRLEGGASDDVLDVGPAGAGLQSLTFGQWPGPDGTERIDLPAGRATGALGADTIVAPADRGLDVSAFVASTTFVGTPHDDRVHLAAGTNVVRTGAGDDEVSLDDDGDDAYVPGDDRVYLGVGDDRVTGHGGTDRVVGGPGRDVLDYRKLGPLDNLFGSTAADLTARMGGGADRVSLLLRPQDVAGLDIAGSAGTDRLGFELASGYLDRVDRARLSLESGRVVAFARSGRSTGAVASFSDVTVAGEARWTVLGTAGDDTVRQLGRRALRATTYAGDDRVVGGSGNDVIATGTGRDFVDGRAGSDRCTGAERVVSCER